MSSYRLRKIFTFPAYDLAAWFPGHMFKGTQQLQKKIGDMDCIVEVHDARIPFSGRNPLFNRHGQMRPHLLVLNKIDKVDATSLHWLKNNRDKLGASKVLFTNLKKKSENFAYKLLDETLDVIAGNERFHRTSDASYNILIVGVPNVGKSSLINFFRNYSLRRKGKATTVGANPGMTKAVLEKIRVSDNPPIFLYDSPGILTPRIESAEVALKLALCNTIRSRVLGEELIADYLLFTLNKQEMFSYVPLYDMDGPSDDIMTVLKAIAAKHSKFTKHKIDNEYSYLPNYHFASHKMLKDFDAGELGVLNLDGNIIDSYNPIT